jgi:hypothetical protein
LECMIKHLLHDFSKPIHSVTSNNLVTSFWYHLRGLLRMSNVPRLHMQIWLNSWVSLYVHTHTHTSVGWISPFLGYPSDKDIHLSFVCWILNFFYFIFKCRYPGQMSDFFFIFNSTRILLLFLHIGHLFIKLEISRSKYQKLKNLLAIMVAKIVQKATSFFLKGNILSQIFFFLKNIPKKS